MFDHLDAIDTQVAALAAMSDDDLADIDGDRLGDAILRLDTTIRQLQAVRLNVTRAHSRSMAWKHDGARSPSQWHRDRRHGISGGQAARDVNTAHGLDELPRTAAAVADGTASVDQAAIAARARKGLNPDQVAALDELVATTAGDATDRQLRDAIADFAHQTNPDEQAERERQAFERRSLRMGRARDGGWWFDGRLDSIGGETLATAISTLATPRGETDTRTAEQRRADALVDLAERALRANELPAEGGGRPAVTVTADLDTLHRRAGAPAGRADHTGPVSGETVRQLACDANIHRVITRGASEILDVGRVTRAVSRAQRRALAARDGGCIGCDAPPGWTDAHHVIHWADGGPTDLANLVLLCRSCHTGIHHRKWRITRDPNGRYRVKQPPRHHPDEPEPARTRSDGQPPAEPSATHDDPARDRSQDGRRPLTLLSVP
ncbi:HNH endonuclease signature motif containing protein [soil metagenome]